MFLIGLLQMIEKLDDDLFFIDDIIFVNEDSKYVILFSDEMGNLSVDLNINLDDVDFDKMILKLLFMSHLWLGVIDLNNVKHLKKK